MLKIERHNIIEQEIRKQGYVLVPGLSELLDCSEETIRRDLKEMEKAGKLVRTHGGAYLIEKYDKGYPIELRKSYLQHTKERLAETAMSLIRENDVIMLDASTTCLAIAQAILASGMSATIITNSLEVCNLFGEVNSNINLICVGGTYRRRTSSFADPNTVEALRRYYADIATTYGKMLTKIIGTCKLFSEIYKYWINYMLITNYLKIFKYFLDIFIKDVDSNLQHLQINCKSCEFIL